MKSGPTSVSEGLVDNFSPPAKNQLDTNFVMIVKEDIDDIIANKIEK